MYICVIVNTGAITEFEKEEGITYDPDRNRVSSGALAGASGASPAHHAPLWLKKMTLCR
jgi:hypothetical protein